ncbi:NAD(P)-dependent oxidoreductase [Ktedonospora formicarum]|nr:NAD(P)-binding domain-containing protein [Ktedonospora formicarum]
MSDVSVIGLGQMGRALTHALLEHGNHVTIWNRTRPKAESLIQEGAVLAENAASAADASPVVIMCVADYEIADSILKTEEVVAALRGRILVQLSTGSPQQARESEAWARARSIDYLDGAIAATPVQIGKPNSTIFVSGVQAAFQRSESLLKSLTGNVVYLGELIGAASAVDLAFLSYLFGSMLGFFHGARLLEAEGLQVASLGPMIASTAPAIGAMMKNSADAIARDAYEHPESSLKICAEGVELLLRQAQETHINNEFPKFATHLFGKAVTAGYGNEKAAALMKVLRADAH